MSDDERIVDRCENSYHKFEISPGLGAKTAVLPQLIIRCVDSEERGDPRSATGSSGQNTDVRNTSGDS